MNNHLQIIKRIMEKGRSYIPAFIALAGMNAVLVPVEFYGLLLSRKMIDRGFLLRNWPTIKGIILILFGLFVLRSLINYANAILSTNVQLRMNQRFQNELFSHLLHLPMPFFMEESTGQLMSRLLDDATLFSAILKAIFHNALLDPLKLLLLTTLLAYFNLRLCLIMVVSTFFTFLVIRWMGHRLREISKRTQEKNAAIYSFVAQIFSNIELIKSKITEKKESERFHHHIDEFIELALKTLKISLIAQPILQILKYATLGIVFIYGSWMISKDILTIGTLTIFLGATYLFFNTLNSLGNTYGDLSENLARMEILFSILDTPPEGSEKQTSVIVTPHINTIEFKHVSFGYHPSQPVLNDLSFSVNKGETLGITGQSGSGKTTIIRLLVGFYEPNTGEINLDKVSLRHCDLATLRQAIGIVFQENLIFNDSVRYNIEYGLGDIPESKIIQAAKTSQAHEFIRAMPGQYETIIGEQGKRLSGGEKQRLAIARAIVAEPEILILDEGTSFLEVEQEKAILKRIRHMRKEKITIIISHRLSAMESVDRMLTLDNGRMIETNFRALAGISY
ncbi:MAG: ABC transporter ATP-binding protein [bacterium]